MSGFWAARGRGEVGRRFVKLTQRREDFRGGFDGWGHPKVNMRRLFINIPYRHFLRLTGVRLKPGEGPVYVPIGEVKL